METFPSQERLFLNADFNDFNDLRHLNSDFGGKIHAVKLGMAFLSNARATDIHNLLKRTGAKTFLDSKFHEDPDQMSFVIGQYERQGYSYLSVTAGAAPRAIANARLTANDTHIVSSVSHSASKFFSPELQNLEEVNYMLANETEDKRLDIVMCNAGDIERVKSVGDFAVIATGIRLEGQASDDHATTATPAQALSAGADYLSIGRAVTLAEDKIATLNEVLENMRSANQ